MAAVLTGSPGRRAGRGAAALAAAVLWCCAALPGGCTPPPDDGWRASAVRPDGRASPMAQVDPVTGRRAGDEGYFLYVLTDSVGLDFSSSGQFLTTLHKHPHGQKDDRTVGHSWLILEDPQALLECGHTGEFGVERPTYYQGMYARMRSGDPNPVAYLHTVMTDGQFHRGPRFHTPTYVCRIPITARQHAAILAYIEGYDYRRFSVTDHNCTDFVAGAARLAGLNLAHVIRIDLPPQVDFRGGKVRLWTDPKYRRLELGVTEVLQEDLQRLVAEGIGVDARSWYAR